MKILSSHLPGGNLEPASHLLNFPYFLLLLASYVLCPTVRSLLSFHLKVAGDPPPELAGSDRSVTLTGTKEAVEKARDVLAQISRTGKLPDTLFSNALPGESTATIMIDKSKVGLIIGGLKKFLSLGVGHNFFPGQELEERKKRSY